MTRSSDHATGPASIATLLRGFVPAPLEPAQLAAIAAYLNLLLRWNARLNLTSVREPNNIVTRHIGESLFAAARLLPDPLARLHAIDVGSGAGFPGLPLKIYAPRLRLTLIESQQKKATFLKEVVRALGLADTEVFGGRAEVFAGRGDLVTLRAVERFEQVLPVAASLLRTRTQMPEQSAPLAFGPVQPPPRLALLISAAQAERARGLLPGFGWEEPVPIPQSSARILLVGVPEQ